MIDAVHMGVHASVGQQMTMPHGLDRARGCEKGPARKKALAVLPLLTHPCIFSVEPLALAGKILALIFLVPLVRCSDFVLRVSLGHERSRQEGHLSGEISAMACSQSRTASGVGQGMESGQQGACARE